MNVIVTSAPFNRVNEFIHLCKRVITHHTSTLGKSASTPVLCICRTKEPAYLAVWRYSNDYIVASHLLSTKNNTIDDHIHRVWASPVFNETTCFWVKKDDDKTSESQRPSHSGEEKV